MYIIRVLEGTKSSATNERLSCRFHSVPISFLALIPSVSLVSLLCCWYFRELGSRSRKVGNLVCSNPFQRSCLNPNGDSSSRFLVLLFSASSPSQKVYRIAWTMDVHHEGNLARLREEIVSSSFASVFFH